MAGPDSLPIDRLRVRRMSSTGTMKKLSSSFIAYNKGGRSPLDKFLQIDCKSGKLDISDAHHYFDYMLSMRPPPPISCFNALLGALAKRRHYSLAISYYKTLSVSGLSSDLATLNILVNCYSRMKLGSAAFSAFGLVLKQGYRPDNFTFTSLVKGLCLEQKVGEAACLLPKMIRFGCDPNVVTYNTIIDGLCKTGNVVTALQLHRAMVHPKEGMSLEECCKTKNTLRFPLIDGSCIADSIQKGAGILLDVVSYNCLIDGLCRSGMEEEARSLFVELIDHGLTPDLVTFNILINLLCKKGKVEQGMELLEMMISRGVLPDIVTYNTILNGFCRIGKIEEAMKLYRDMSYRGVSANNVTINTLLKGLFRCYKLI